VRRPTDALALLFWASLSGSSRLLPSGASAAGTRLDAGLCRLTATFLPATLSQLRFLNLLALDVALLAGIIVERQILPRRARRQRVVASVALLVLVAPALVAAARMPVAPLEGLDALEENLEMLDWFRLATPIPGDRWDTTRPADWGVLGPWSLGSWIENIAERPVVATNFGAETHGLVESVQFSWPRTRSRRGDPRAQSSQVRDRRTRS
jgi:asparagine N-glycosylation enzyme membrane subunit Stt3